MKKVLLLVLLLSVLLSAFTVFGQAFRLSYATNCLAQGIELVKGGIFGQDVRFNDADIKQALTVTGFDKLIIRSLPDRTLGVLKIGKVEVAEGQVITRDNIENMVFTPANDKVEEATFTFTCDKLCGGAEIKCRLRFTDKQNLAPTTAGVTDASVNVWTQKNITVFGRMTGDDPENDDMTFMVVSYPKKGSLEIVNENLGDFRYTPKNGFKGSDAFTYVVRDSYGNYSSPTVVNIRVGKRVIDIEYSDMQGHSATNAAMVMEKERIMQGRIEGDGYFFDPDKTVSREEFVVMAMKVLGIAARTDVKNTFFDDDTSISEASKPYIATAQRYGYILGEFSGTSLCFHPKETISRGEASVILAKMMGVKTGDTEVNFSDEDTIPVWAKNEISTLYQMGIFHHSTVGEIEANAPMTRADAAEAFLKVMEGY